MVIGDQTVLKIDEFPADSAKLINARKFMHLSIDDTISLFSDLAVNSDRYASLFDNATLAYFKSLHDTYGAVISCYVYNTDGRFSLSSTPDIFRSEFIKASDWLKFGFHSLQAVNYAATTAAKAQHDYDTVIAQLIRITGSSECIDRVVRLHNFAGNLASMLAMKHTYCGILGLLCADDPRKSYYLDTAASHFIYNHNRYFDSSTQLIFLATDLRVESVSDLTGKLAEFKNIQAMNKSHDLVIFTHEGQLNSANKAKLEECCQFAIENDYDFAFPMNVLRTI